MRNIFESFHRHASHLAGRWVLCSGILGAIATPALGQSAPPATRSPAPANAKESAAEGRSIVIERAPVIFRDPQKYQVNLHLQPVRKVTISSTVDGVVGTVLAQIGQEIASQAEVIRLDNQLGQLQLKKAQAALKAAKADLAVATAKEGAEARVEIADADLAIAELAQSRHILRSTLKGIVTGIRVVEGEFVHAGQPLLDVVDPSELYVQVPVDGKTQRAGETIDIKVEDENVSATLGAVLPLTPEFDSLRDLFLSPATGRVTLDNAKGKWRVGQTVYSPMIPRLPVAEVPSSSVVNGDQGVRKVQVIREGFVRDIPVQLLGQIGTDHLFVSGRFGVTDELISKTSEPLLDGARVTPKEAKSTSSPANSIKPAQTAPSGNNF